MDIPVGVNEGDVAVADQTIENPVEQHKPFPFFLLGIRQVRERDRKHFGSDRKNVQGVERNASVPSRSEEGATSLQDLYQALVIGLVAPHAGRFCAHER